MVFENIDAATGKKVELQEVSTLTPMELAKQKEQVQADQKEKDN